MKHSVVAALSAALSLTRAASHAVSAAAKACAADIEQYCGRVKPGGGAIKAWVKAHFSDLSGSCQAQLVRLATVGSACKGDVTQFRA